MFLCIYYLYFLWFSSKPLFAIARYSLLAFEKNTPLFVIARYNLRYSLLVLGKNTPLFIITRYLKLWLPAS